MNRQDVCILINSTPKYFYILPLQLTMLKRYAPFLHWPIYFATEYPNHPFVQKLETQFSIQIIPLEMKDAGFLESRHAALVQLPSQIKFVLPLQEDFLLDRSPNREALEDALFILDTDRYISSLRLNPCPGPHETDGVYCKEKPWKILGPADNYIFTYQATLWRRLDLTLYFNSVLSFLQKKYPNLNEEQSRNLALVTNLGENPKGQQILKQSLPDTLHLSCPRAGPWSNAVYLSPWPYRPTAIVRGKLEPWAEELFQREGVKIETLSL